MAGTTRSTLSTRVSSLEVEVSAVRSDIAELKALLVANLNPTQPAKVTRKAQPKAVVCISGVGHTFSGTRVGTGARKLSAKNRKAFIAAHAWALPHTSTSGLRNAVAAGAKVNAGWNVAI